MRNFQGAADAAVAEATKSRNPTLRNITTILYIEERAARTPVFYGMNQ